MTMAALAAGDEEADLEDARQRLRDLMESPIVLSPVQEQERELRLALGVGV